MVNIWTDVPTIPAFTSAPRTRHFLVSVRVIALPFDLQVRSQFTARIPQLCTSDLTSSRHETGEHMEIRSRSVRSLVRYENTVEGAAF